MFAFVIILYLSVLAEAASRSSRPQPASPTPEQYTKMLPTSEDDCRGLSTTAGAIVRQREKGKSHQRQRDEWTKIFARDRATPPVFSHFQRATIFSWLLEDIYGPSVFLSDDYATRAMETWCHTAVVTSHRDRVPFTLALFTADLLRAISTCTNSVELGLALVRLRDHGLPLADAIAILRVGIAQGIIASTPYTPNAPHYGDIMEFIKRSRNTIDENIRVLEHVAVAIYANISVTQTIDVKQVNQLCLEVWIP
jgi:hypothetical protein